MADPIEIVLFVRRRLMRHAVLRILLLGIFPVSLTLAIIFCVDPLNELALDRFGYLIDSSAVRLFQISLLILALTELVAIVLLAWHAASDAGGFIRTAERIDQFVGGRQEIVTVASFCDPAHPQAVNMRSPLF